MTTVDRGSLVAADKAARSRLQTLPLGDVLLLAPPGCGKTEGLALRAHALVSRGDVSPPRRLLALTFSNRARENLQERIREKLQSRAARVHVTNLHRFSSRLIRAHHGVLGLSDDWFWPQKGWRRSLIKEVTQGNGDRAERLEAALRQVKSRPITDAEVLDQLNEMSMVDAITFEQRRLAENRFDFQDLLRHAQRLLLESSVRHVYRLHFSGVVLDEAQDLTQQQLDIALAVGGSRTTAAADVEQGIYSFAGADASAVVNRLRKSEPIELQLHCSYRSADAVLSCVNALADQGGDLVAAEPHRWPDGGCVASPSFSTKQEEADHLISYATQLASQRQNLSIGFLSRHRFRMDTVIDTLAERDVPHSVWDRPTDNPALGRVLRGCLSQTEAPDDESRLRELMDLARIEIDPTDAELLDQLQEAHAILGELISTISLDGAIERCANRRSATAVPSGIHVLTGHQGKGQQFDWVFIVGLEEGVVPHYKADTSDKIAEEKRLLRVMVSRARYGLVTTFVMGWPNRYGKWMQQHPCGWFDSIRSAVTHEWVDLAF